MARLTSLSMLLTTTGKDYLAESYGKVIENVQKATISSMLKNKDLSGDPTTGTVEAKRFTNTASSTYGTARAAHAGTQAKVVPVTIAIDQDKEIIHEVEDKDVKLYGVEGYITKEQAKDTKAMERELERAFFTEAETVATSVQTSATDIEEIVEAAIQSVETVQNNFVDGVERDMINLVLTPAYYGKLRTYLDKVELDGQREGYALYHGVKVFSSVYLPTGTNGIVMADGAIAQPVMPTVAEPDKIQLSNAYAFGLFYSYGTKSVADDLIFKF